MKKSDFYYDLPPELIAQHPLDRRDDSRLMMLSKDSGEISHTVFHDLPQYLNAGDCLVLNDTRVLPARLIGVREGTKSSMEILLLTDRGDDVWECLTKPGRKAKQGTVVVFGDGLLRGTVTEVLSSGNRLIRFTYTGVFMEILSQLGEMPLPPYIKEKLEDPERYQTVYSKEVGSAAAPTAGLHFTEDLLQKIREKGVKICYLTLHVGLGTFRPVKEDDIRDHVMHSEFYQIDEQTAAVINETREHGGRVVCVGTTSCRTLETVAQEDGTVVAGSGWTDIFIYPGYRFKTVDALITNFHLPESTLVMLVSALAGRETILKAYETAVQLKYRFFSFGDAMFIY